MYLIWDLIFSIFTPLVHPRIITEAAKKRTGAVQGVHLSPSPASTASRGPGTRGGMAGALRLAGLPAQAAHPAYLVDSRARVGLGAQRGHRVPVIGARSGGSSAGAAPQR